MTKKFNPRFEDKIFNEKIKDIDLIMPPEIYRSEGLSFWVDKRTIFDEYFIVDKDTTKKVSNIHGKTLTSVVRPPDYKNISNFIQQSSSGEYINQQMPKELYEFIFPPRVWMSNNINEITNMYNVAKIAKGNVLAGGLGLGIYPQYIFALDRPVESITIVDNDKDIVDVIGKILLDNFKDKKIKIVYDTIENFMQNTTEKFDTVYLDTWGDLNFKFLFYINYLISMADKITSENGIIGAWGYKHMYENFLDIVSQLDDHKDAWEHFYTTKNEVIIKYIEERKQRPEMTKKEYMEFANDMILNTIDPTPIELTMLLSNNTNLNKKFFY